MSGTSLMNIGSFVQTKGGGKKGKSKGSGSASPQCLVIYAGRLGIGRVIACRKKRVLAIKGPPRAQKGAKVRVTLAASVRIAVRQDTCRPHVPRKVVRHGHSNNILLNILTVRYRVCP